jgi:hypothetical protein
MGGPVSIDLRKAEYRAGLKKFANDLQLEKVLGRLLVTMQRYAEAGTLAPYYRGYCQMKPGHDATADFKLAEIGGKWCWRQGRCCHLHRWLWLTERRGRNPRRFLYRSASEPSRPSPPVQESSAAEPLLQ